jgi:hypothetical protein
VFDELVYKGNLSLLGEFVVAVGLEALFGFFAG